MLTPEDIKNLTDFQIEVFKDIFATKEDVEEIKQRLNTLTNSVDSYGKDVKDGREEIIILTHRLDNVQNHMQQIADKVGIKLEY
jgi:ribosomal protein S15P/S13E